MRRPRLKLAWSALKLAFGGAASPVVAVLVVLVVAAIGWAGDTLYSMAPGSPWWLAPLGLLLVLFFWGGRKAELISPVVRQGPAKPARVLIWFLSPPGGPGLERETDPNAMRSWRMAHEAISHHHQRGRLERVVVIPSADAGSKRNGTFRFIDDFRHTMAVSTGIPADWVRLAPGCQYGVDFESAEELSEVLENTLEELAAEGYSSEDVVIDVTGGQKPPAVIGGIFGLGDGRRIEYVSTGDYDVLEYDITLE